MSCDSELFSLIKSQRTEDIYKLTYLIAKQILVIYYSAPPQLNCMQNLTINFTKLQVLENIHNLLVQRSQSWMQDSRRDFSWTEGSSRIPPHPPTLWGCSPGHGWFLGCQNTQLGHIHPQTHHHLQVFLLLCKLLWQQSELLSTRVPAALQELAEHLATSWEQSSTSCCSWASAGPHSLQRLLQGLSLHARSWGLGGSAGRTAGLHNACEAVENLVLVISCWPCQSLTESQGGVETSKAGILVNCSALFIAFILVNTVPLFPVLYRG